MVTIFKESFESGEWSHKCRVFPTNGPSYEKDVGNIFTPKDWVFWFRHGTGADDVVWDQPEGHNTWKAVDEHRIHTGKGAYMYFASFRRMDAGLMRQISVVRGRMYKVTAWGHAWSNHLSASQGGHPNDGRWSDGVGYGAAAWSTSPELPHDTGDPQTDARPNFTFMVGIDRYGGTNPFAKSVVWGPGLHIYNEYARLESKTVQALSDTITIFLRAKTLWAFQHNDAYWDDVEVIESEDGDPPPPTSYSSTMLVLPQDATPNQLTEVMSAGFPHRRTFGFSHDDAAALSGTAVLYNIPSERRQSYIDWYAAHNPNVAIEWAYTSDWKEPSAGWEQYLVLQRDYGGKFGAGSGCSIASEGCFITCVAMAQRIYEIAPEATPVSVDALLGKSGYADCLARWIPVREKCGIRVTDRGNLDLHLADSLVAMLEVDFSPGPDMDQHFVLAVEKVGDDYRILDPWYGPGMLSEHYDGYKSFRLLYPYTHEPTPTPNLEGTTGISLHLQSMDPGWKELVQETRPRLVKVLASLQDVYGVLEASPETVVVVRHVNNNYGDTLEHPDPHQGARNWLSKFRDSLIEVATEARRRWPECEIVVESVNECVPSLNAAGVVRLVNFDIAFIDELGKLNLPGVKPGVLNAAVANPHESEFRLLIPLARACAEAGGYMDYHSYWRGFPDGSRLESEYQWYSGRWAEMDKVFTREGIYVKWYGGESGVYATASDGWLSWKCYDGDWDRYFDDIKLVIDIERAWNKEHGNRKFENALFTTGTGVGWETFQLQHPQIRAITDYLLKE